MAQKLSESRNETKWKSEELTTVISDITKIIHEQFVPSHSMIVTNISQQLEGHEKVMKAKSVVVTNYQTRIKTPRIRLNALIIKTNESRSYKDVFKSLRCNTKATQLGERVRAIKKTRSGDILMTVKHKGNHNIESIAKEIKEALGEGLSVRQLGNSKLIQIGHLDEIMSKEEIIEAIQNKLGTGLVVEKIIVRNLHVWTDGTQTANVLIPEPEAKKLLRKGKIKVGWLIYPVRIQDKLTRCYKNHDFNHY